MSKEKAVTYSIKDSTGHVYTVKADERISSGNYYEFNLDGKFVAAFHDVLSCIVDAELLGNKN